jgi:hypothetical protein
MEPDADNLLSDSTRQISFTSIIDYVGPGYYLGITSELQFLQKRRLSSDSLEGGGGLQVENNEAASAIKGKNPVWIV